MILILQDKKMPRELFERELRTLMESAESSVRLVDVGDTVANLAGYDRCVVFSDFVAKAWADGRGAAWLKELEEKIEVGLSFVLQPHKFGQTGLGAWHKSLDWRDEDDANCITVYKDRSLVGETYRLRVYGEPLVDDREYLPQPEEDPFGRPMKVLAYQLYNSKDANDLLGYMAHLPIFDLKYLKLVAKVKGWDEGLACADLYYAGLLSQVPGAPEGLWCIEEKSRPWCKSYMSDEDRSSALNSAITNLRIEYGIEWPDIEAAAAKDGVYEPLPDEDEYGLRRYIFDFLRKEIWRWEDTAE